MKYLPPMIKMCCFVHLPYDSSSVTNVKYIINFDLNYMQLNFSNFNPICMIIDLTVHHQVHSLGKSSLRVWRYNRSTLRARALVYTTHCWDSTQQQFRQVWRFVKRGTDIFSCTLPYECQISLSIKYTFPEAKQRSIHFYSVKKVYVAHNGQNRSAKIHCLTIIFEWISQRSVKFTDS